MGANHSESRARYSAQSDAALYNTVRLHSAIGYVTPQDLLSGLAPEIFAERDRKLTEARERRAAKRRAEPAAA